MRMVEQPSGDAAPSGGTRTNSQGDETGEGGGEKQMNEKYACLDRTTGYF